MKETNIKDKTIAELPFINISANVENEYFIDGITEEIINALAKIEQLKVISRTSSFDFKNHKAPISEIGKKQLYGTHIKFDNLNRVPYPVMYPGHVDQRRAEIGLGPLRPYLKNRFNIDWQVTQEK